MNRKKTLTGGAAVLFLLFLLIAGLEKGTHSFDFGFVQFQSPLFFLAILLLALGAFFMFALFALFPPLFIQQAPSRKPEVPKPGSSNAPSRLRLAEIESEMGNVADAAAALREFLPGDPDYSRAQFQLGGLAASELNDEEAEFRFQQALKASVGPERGPVLLALAHLYERQEKMEMARDMYFETGRLFPELPAPFFHLRSLAIGEEDWEDAMMWQVHLEDHFQELLSGEDESSLKIGLRYEFAASQKEQGAFKNAQSLIKNVLRLTDSFTPAYLLAGEILEKLDNGSAAVRMWEQGFESTGHPALIQRVCEAYLLENLPERAVEFAQLCARRHPGRADLEYTLGDLYLRLEMVREAQQLFEKLHSSHPEWPLASRTLADIYRKAGDFRKASSLYAGLVDRQQSVLPWICPACSTTTERYRGRCGNCQQWNTVEINVQAGSMDMDEKNTAIRY